MAPQANVGQYLCLTLSGVFVKLFFMPGTCALAPHIVLIELGMVYETEIVKRADKTCASGDYLKINPKGSVPALKMENGEVLTEGAIISQYLADQKNDGSLLPKFGTLDRVRTLEMMNYISTEVHKNFTPLFQASSVYKSIETQNEVKEFYKSTLNTKFKFLSEKLEGHDFIMGKTFTIADAYLFTCLSWTKHAGVDLSGFPKLTSYLVRISERPSVMRAMKEQGLTK